MTNVELADTRLVLESLARKLIRKEQEAETNNLEIIAMAHRLERAAKDVSIAQELLGIVVPSIPPPPGVW